MIDLVGFNGIEPYIVLEWHDETGPRFKTVCYTEEEMNEMLARHNDSTDFYVKYKPVVRGYEISDVRARVS